MTLSREDLQRALTSLGGKAPNAISQFHPNQTDLTVLAEMLSLIPADAPRGNGSLTESDGQPVQGYWFGIILAAQREWGEKAKPLLQSWSQTSDRYTVEGFELAWREARKPHSHPVGVKSLRRLAERYGWRQAPSRKRYRLLGRDAIMDLQPIEWRVKGIFPRIGIGAIFGPSGSGKSFLAIDLGLRIAAGDNWFERRTTPCPVAYVMLEGEAGLRNRLAAWEKISGKEIPLDFAGVAQAFAFSEDGDVADLAMVLPKGGVVIVDTLNRAAPGKDENSSKDMGEVLAGMKALQHLTEGLVLVVHHTGKDLSKGMRGHSSLHAALDGAVEVKRNGSTRSWSAAKVKDGTDDMEVPFKLDVIHLGFDPDGDEITSCVATGDAAALFKPKRPSGKSQLPAWEALQSTGCSEMLYSTAISVIATTLGDVPSKRRTTRAKEILTNLVDGGFLPNMRIGE